MRIDSIQVSGTAITPLGYGSFSIPTLAVGISNMQATLTGTTLGLTVQSGSIGITNPMHVTMPVSALSGQLQWFDVVAPISMTLPSATYSGQILQFSTNDGQATLRLNTNAVNVVFFWYLLYDSPNIHMGISRSPFHTKIPANYLHTPSATTLTAVGSGSPGVWDQMIISKTGAVTDANAPTVCLGPLCIGTVAGNTGRFSAMSLIPGEFPKFNNRRDPLTLDGTNAYRHELRMEMANGYGTTDTQIRKFSNVTINNGYAAQVLVSGGCTVAGSIGGTEVIFTEPGDYSIGYVDSFAASQRLGLSLNSNQRTNQLGGIITSTILTANMTNAANATANVNYTGYFQAGAIVRPHTESNGSGSGTVTAPIMTVKKISWGQGS